MLCSRARHCHVTFTIKTGTPRRIKLKYYDLLNYKIHIFGMVVKVNMSSTATPWQYTVILRSIHTS